MATIEEKVWLDYTQQELNDQYNQSTLVPNVEEYQQMNLRDSNRIKEVLECRLNVPYGPSDDEILDIFPAAEKGAPVVVYIHGGAWTRSHKDSAAYQAEAFVGAGANYVTVNFALVPKVDLDELVRQNRAAIKWVYENAAGFGADPNKLYVAGHSSGGHVAGMMYVTDWTEWGMPADAVKGVLAGSGMYDLEPVRLSARNDYLQLDEAAMRRNSAILQIPANPPPLIVCYGGGEQKEFRRQSQDFVKALRERDLPVQEFDLPDLNHFDVGQQYNNPDGPVLKAMFEMMGL